MRMTSGSRQSALIAEDRHPRDALHSSGDSQLEFACANTCADLSHRIDAGSAEPVDRDTWHGRAPASHQVGGPGQVRPLFADLGCDPQHHILDPDRIQPSARHALALQAHHEVQRPQMM
jgi:hypothetical protein